MGDTDLAPQHFGTNRNGLLCNAGQFAGVAKHLNHIDRLVDCLERRINFQATNFLPRKTWINRQHFIPGFMQHAQHTIAKFGFIATGANHCDGFYAA